MSVAMKEITVEKDKYSLAEAGLILAGLPALFVAVCAATIPLGILAAWMRVKMWDWFMVPYFHLPHIGVPLMYAIGLFIVSFRAGTRSLKNEYYATGFFSNGCSEFVVSWVGFGIAYALHVWWLKG